MTTLTAIRDIQQAKTSLLEKVKILLSNYKTINNIRQPIIRIELKINRADPLDWLQQINNKHKCYWRKREDNCERAGFGIADIVNNYEQIDFHQFLQPIKEKLKKSPSARYYGGFDFDSESYDKTSEDQWNSFGSGRFVLPRFELITDNGISTFACNILKEEIDKIDCSKLDSQLIEQEGNPFSNDVNSNKSFTRFDNPDHDGWVKILAEADELIRNGELSKIVLARCSTITKKEILNPWKILKKLRNETVNCFLFGIQPEASSIFIGASPELLFSRNYTVVKSEAIAGTKPRGDSDATDYKKASDLLMSDKERREHQWVVKAIDERLKKLCTRLITDQQPQTLKLAKVQHLVTHFEGELNEGINDSDLLAALHPTPAVGGYPNHFAVDNIRRLEPFNRGWYAGPIGLIGDETTEIAVGIRSALIRLKVITLFSGAGIVKGSIPDSEWDEIEAKMSHFEKMAFRADR